MDKKTKVFGLILGVCVLGLGALFYRNTHPELGYYQLPMKALETTPTTPTGTVTGVPQLVVHISGEVPRPGVYQVPKGTRVLELIKFAGGAYDGADLDKLKLANLLKDGQKINVVKRKPL